MSARTSLKAIAAQRMSAQVSYRQNTFLVSYSFPQLTVYLAIGAPGANANWHVTEVTKAVKFPSPTFAKHL